jgi:hypothetical protein
VVQLFTFLTLIICFGCQQPTEPSNIVVGKGFDVTVRVHDQAGQPLAGVSVQWAILGGKQVTFTMMPRAGNDGEFAATIPVPVASDSALVVIRTDIPTGTAGAEFKGIQKNGDFRLDTVRICRNASIDIALTRQVTISKCGTLSCTPISLLCEFPDKVSDSSCTPEYVNSTTEILTLSPVTSSAPFVTTKAKVNGGIVNTPATIPIGARFQICYYFTPSINSPVSRDQFTENIVASSPTNPLCLTCTFPLTTEIRRKEDCDCPNSPKPIVFPTDTTKRVDVCIGKDTTVDIPIGVKNDNRATDCDIEFSLISPSSTAEFEVVSANNGLPKTVRISPGASFGKLSVRFSPNAVNNYDFDIRYAMRVIKSDGTVKQCTDQLLVQFHGAGGQSSCDIDTVGSTIFIAPAKKLLDTLKNCVDVDLSSNARTLKIINKGKCDVTISASFNTPLFAVVTPTTLQIPAGKSDSFTLKFLPKATDVWPNGRGSKPGIINFSGQLTLTGCKNQVYTIKGLADTACNYSLYQCMHKWSETLGKWFEVIQMDRSNNIITYKNNPAITTDRDIFIDAINVPALTAMLNSDFSHWKVVGSHPSAFAGETACSFGGQYINSCDAAAPTGQIPVKLWDVVSFTINYTDGRQFCGIIWIVDIRNDTQNASGVPTVCMQICYPL